MSTAIYRTVCALFLSIGVAGAVLAGAPAQAADVEAAAIRFADASTLSTDATSLTLFVNNRPPREYPHVMYRAPFTFEQAAKAWAMAHFSLSGNSVNTLRITLRDGDITEKLLPKTGGFKGLFTKDQAAEYDATLALEVAIVDPSGKVLSSADGKAIQTRTIQEGATEEDKRTMWADIIKTTFDSLDAEMLPRLRMSMAAYIH